MMENAQSKIRVEIPTQKMTLSRTRPDGGEEVLACYDVSTSGFGVGSQEGSNCTPLGEFLIADMIGGAAPLGMVFVGREATGEIAPPSAPEDPRDVVATRILRLHGLEPHNANTYARYIYIHGTNHEELIGTPCSHGCVRMRNTEVAELYLRVGPGTRVTIVA